MFSVDQDLACVDDDLAATAVDLDVHRAGAVQPQQGAVCQTQFAAFARACAVIGQHPFHGQGAPGQQAAGAEQGDCTQAVAQHGAAPGKVVVDAAQRVSRQPCGRGPERATQAFDLAPDARVLGVGRQPAAMRGHVSGGDVVRT
ncbi:hypothetical protein Ddc_22434 [Ditylenchus destructor]|nr:hypothetical protein Ddc_22434 [Ditylenchus destructor]